MNKSRQKQQQLAGSKTTKSQELHEFKMRQITSFNIPNGFQKDLTQINTSEQEDQSISIFYGMTKQQDEQSQQVLENERSASDQATMDIIKEKNPQNRNCKDQNNLSTLDIYSTDYSTQLNMQFNKANQILMESLSAQISMDFQYVQKIDLNDQQLLLLNFNSSIEQQNLGISQQLQAKIKEFDSVSFDIQNQKINCLQEIQQLQQKTINLKQEILKFENLQINQENNVQINQENKLYFQSQQNLYQNTNPNNAQQILSTQSDINSTEKIYSYLQRNFSSNCQQNTTDIKKLQTIKQQRYENYSLQSLKTGESQNTYVQNLNYKFQSPNIHQHQSYSEYKMHQKPNIVQENELARKLGYNPSNIDLKGVSMRKNIAFNNSNISSNQMLGTNSAYKNYEDGSFKRLYHNDSVTFDLYKSQNNINFIQNNQIDFNNEQSFLVDKSNQESKQFSFDENQKDQNENMTPDEEESSSYDTKEPCNVDSNEADELQSEIAQSLRGLVILSQSQQLNEQISSFKKQDNEFNQTGNFNELMNKIIGEYNFSGKSKDNQVETEVQSIQNLKLNPNQKDICQLIQQFSQTIQQNTNNYHQRNTRNQQNKIDITQHSGKKVEEEVISPTNETEEYQIVPLDSDQIPLHSTSFSEYTNENNFIVEKNKLNGQLALFIQQIDTKALQIKNLDKQLQFIQQLNIFLKETFNNFLNFNKQSIKNVQQVSDLNIGFETKIQQQNEQILQSSVIMLTQIDQLKQTNQKNLQSSSSILKEIQEFNVKKLLAWENEIRYLQDNCQLKQFKIDKYEVLISEISSEKNQAVINYNKYQKEMNLLNKYLQKYIEFNPHSNLVQQDNNNQQFNKQSFKNDVQTQVYSPKIALEAFKEIINENGKLKKQIKKIVQTTIMNFQNLKLNKNDNQNNYKLLHDEQQQQIKQTLKLLELDNQSLDSNFNSKSKSSYNSGYDLKNFLEQFQIVLDDCKHQIQQNIFSQEQQIQNQINDIQQINLELNRKNEQVSLLNKQIGQIQDNMDKLQSELYLRDRNNEKLNSSHERICRETLSLKLHIEQQEQTKQIKENQIIAMNVEEKYMQVKISKQDQTIFEFQQELQRKKIQIQELQGQAIELKNEKAEIHDQNQTHEQKYLNLLKSIKNYPIDEIIEEIQNWIAEQQMFNQNFIENQDLIDQLVLSIENQQMNEKVQKILYRIVNKAKSFGQTREKLKTNLFYLQSKVSDLRRNANNYWNNSSLNNDTISLSESRLTMKNANRQIILSPVASNINSRNSFTKSHMSKMIQFQDQKDQKDQISQLFFQKHASVDKLDHAIDYSSVNQELRLRLDICLDEKFELERKLKSQNFKVQKIYEIKSKYESISDSFKQLKSRYFILIDKIKEHCELGCSQQKDVQNLLGKLNNLPQVNMNFSLYQETSVNSSAIKSQIQGSQINKPKNELKNYTNIKNPSQSKNRLELNHVSSNKFENIKLNNFFNFSQSDGISQQEDFIIEQNVKLQSDTKIKTGVQSPSQSAEYINNNTILQKYISQRLINDEEFKQEYEQMTNNDKEKLHQLIFATLKKQNNGSNSSNFQYRNFSFGVNILGNFQFDKFDKAVQTEKQQQSSIINEDFCLLIENQNFLIEKLASQLDKKESVNQQNQSKLSAFKTEMNLASHNEDAEIFNSKSSPPVIQFIIDSDQRQLKTRNLALKSNTMNENLSVQLLTQSNQNQKLFNSQDTQDKITSGLNIESKASAINNISQNQICLVPKTIQPIITNPDSKKYEQLFIKINESSQDNDLQQYDKQFDSIAVDLQKYQINHTDSILMKSMDYEKVIQHLKNIDPQTYNNLGRHLSSQKKEANKNQQQKEQIQSRFSSPISLDNGPLENQKQLIEMNKIQHCRQDFVIEDNDEQIPELNEYFFNIDHDQLQNDSADDMFEDYDSTHNINNSEQKGIGISHMKRQEIVMEEIIEGEEQSQSLNTTNSMIKKDITICYKDNDSFQSQTLS